MSVFPRLFGSRIGIYFVLGIIGVVAAFAVFFLITCLCERQYLTGDVEPATEPYPFPPAPYWTATRRDALNLGWQHAGDFATRKDTTVVKGLQSLFISPDRQVIASVVAGSVAVAKLRKIVLRTRLASGRIIESSDNAGLDDFSGVVDRAILLNAGIVELADFHHRRILNSTSSGLPFNANAVLEEFEKIDLDRGARWVMLGLARWADPREASIRMTLRGALASTRRLFLQPGKLEGQEHRTHILRAGSRPGDTPA